MLVKRLFNQFFESLGLTKAAPPLDRGACGECRHANHGTEDAAEGLWACPWLGATDPRSPCRIRYKANGQPVFERFDGHNGTWGTGDPTFRAAPRGYEGREVVLEEGP